VGLVFAILIFLPLTIWLLHDDRAWLRWFVEL
jgi:hypothetical protein